MDLADPGFGKSQNLSDFFQRQFLVVIERDDRLFFGGQFLDRLSQNPFQLLYPEEVQGLFFHVVHEEVDQVLLGKFGDFVA